MKTPVRILLLALCSAPGYSQMTFNVGDLPSLGSRFEPVSRSMSENWVAILPEQGTKNRAGSPVRVIRLTGPLVTKKQFHPSSCGAAALNMVLRHFGEDTTEEQLWREMSKESYSPGLSTEELLAYAKRIGFAGSYEDTLSRNPDKDYSYLKERLERNIPVIVSQSSDRIGSSCHYRTVIGVSSEVVELYDSGEGSIITWSWDEFAFHFHDFWTPKCVVIEPKKECKTLSALLQSDAAKPSPTTSVSERSVSRHEPPWNTNSPADPSRKRSSAPPPDRLRSPKP
jgi:predicted double-glycine peptidase